MILFRNIVKARFLSRLNRFIILCELKGKTVTAFLPNPGRLWELLIPGSLVFLEESPDSERKTRYTSVAIEKDGKPVMLHTHRANDVAHYLLEKEAIPGLEGVGLIQREIKKGRSRFDFLLRREGKDIFLEVKSCTLFSESVAMFPDAVTVRGRRHVMELVSLSGDRVKGAILFLVHSPDVKFFMPEYHTDIDFSNALLKARDKIMIIPLSVRWGKDLSITSDIRVLNIPWDIIEREAMDRGCYLLILRLSKERSLEIGNLGRIYLRRGYYTYVGSGRVNLTKRIDRHRRLRKKRFWHIDYLRSATEFHCALPIRTEDDLECEIARELREGASLEIPGFGSSDCSCISHLFWSETNPLQSPGFHTMLQYYRMERLIRR